MGVDFFCAGTGESGDAAAGAQTAHSGPYMLWQGTECVVVRKMDPQVRDNDCGRMSMMRDTKSNRVQAPCLQESVDLGSS